MILIKLEEFGVLVLQSRIMNDNLYKLLSKLLQADKYHIS